jgi:hypothetical protein
VRGRRCYVECHLCTNARFWTERTGAAFP